MEGFQVGWAGLQVGADFGVVGDGRRQHYVGPAGEFFQAGGAVGGGAKEMEAAVQLDENARPRVRGGFEEQRPFARRWVL